MKISENAKYVKKLLSDLKILEVFTIFGSETPEVYSIFGSENSGSVQYTIFVSENLGGLMFDAILRRGLGGEAPQESRGAWGAQAPQSGITLH